MPTRGRATVVVAAAQTSRKILRDLVTDVPFNYEWQAGSPRSNPRPIRSPGRDQARWLA